jgi:arylsulfatase
MVLDRPNILIIHADEHRFDCLGAMGNSAIKTPHLDALSKDGELFLNCFATVPLCTPSRYSLLTGLYSHQHLGISNQSSLPEGFPTFPKLLREKGYHTVCVGKMHFTPTYADVGYSEMYLAEQDGPGRYDDDYHRELMEKGLVDIVDMSDQVYEYRSKAVPGHWENMGITISNLDEKDYSTTWIGDKACSILEKWKDNGECNSGECKNGECLMIGFIKPHHPFDVPSPWCDLYDPAKIPMLPGWTENLSPQDKTYSQGFYENNKITEDKMKAVLAQYYGSISQIDAYVGKLISILKQKGIYEKTLIIYTSDHGDYMSFHHMILKGNYMYDPVIKVPLIVKYPGQHQGNIQHSQLVSVLDITATILDTADIIIPPHLWNQVQPLSDADREYVFAETANHQFMVRSAKWKLLYCPIGKSQLFDLEKDPYENNNLFDVTEYQSTVMMLKDRLLNWLTADAASISHTNELKRVISGKNLPLKRDESHETVKKWFQNKIMKEI